MLFLSLFILGFTSLVAQIVMARELIVSFYGNEFFIGWILCGWLFWVGVGSVIIKNLDKSLRGLPLLMACHVLVSVLLPLTVFGARAGKSLFVKTAGQIPDFVPAIAASFLVMAPLCLVFGMQFTAALEYGHERHAPQDKTGLAGRAYLYEVLGFMVGGLVFSYGLVFFNEFQTSAVLTLLNSAVVFIALSFEKVAGKRHFLIAAIVAACVGLACLLCSEWLNFRSAAFRFPNEQLVETKNSIYGNLAVTRTAGQLNFYESGLPVGTDKDDAFNEHLVCLPMLSHANPQKVLLIGSGFSGALQEILKYHPKDIFYAELDPFMVDLARRQIPALQGVLGRGELHVIKEDPRLALKRLPRDLDVVIVNLPNPSTALINRYFTDDFFKELRLHVKSDAIVATHLMFAADTVPGPLENLGTSLYKTLQRNFSSIVILPEDVLFILASPSPLISDPQELTHRLMARGINNYFVTGPALVYRYGTDRIAKTMSIFRSNTAARINADLYPQGYLYNFIHWLSTFHQGLADVFAHLVRMNFWIFVCVAVFPIVLLPLVCGSALEKPFLMAAMSLGGFSMMSAELIVIYGFQVFYGNLYYKIAWIISAFMAGTALGIFLGNKNPCRGYIGLMKLHAGIGVYFAIWFALMGLAARLSWTPPPGLWTILGAGMGLLVGLEFPLANHLFFSGQRHAQGSGLGTIYAADLFGSCVGALGVSVFMVPAYGIHQTLLLLVIVNMAIAVVLYIHHQRTKLY